MGLLTLPFGVGAVVLAVAGVQIVKGILLIGRRRANFYGGSIGQALEVRHRESIQM